VVKQVIIHKLVDGVFYSSIICERDKIEEIIDARTSDAIALALRFSAPIFTYKNILDKAGIYLNNPGELENSNPDDEGVLSTPETFGFDSEGKDSTDVYKIMSLSELHEALEKAVKDEDYEKAGFFMLPTGKKDKGTALQIILYTVWLIIASLFPVFFPALIVDPQFYITPIAAVFVLLLGIWMLVYAVKLYQLRTAKAARTLMLVSVSYITLLQLVFIIDKFLR
jgi:bifunctional DNase/RNase